MAENLDDLSYMDAEAKERDHVMDDVSGGVYTSHSNRPYQTQQRRKKRNPKKKSQNPQGRQDGRKNPRAHRGGYKGNRGGRGRGNRGKFRGRGGGRGGSGRGRGRGNRRRGNNRRRRQEERDTRENETSEISDPYGPDRPKRTHKRYDPYEYRVQPVPELPDETPQQPVIRVEAGCLPACHETGVCLCRQKISVKYTDPDTYRRLNGERRLVNQMDIFTMYMMDNYPDQVPPEFSELKRETYDNSDSRYDYTNQEKYKDISIPWPTFFKIMERERKRLYDEGADEYVPLGGFAKKEEYRVQTPFTSARSLRPFVPQVSAQQTPEDSEMVYEKTPNNDSLRTPLSFDMDPEDLYGRHEDFERLWDGQGEDPADGFY